jgi:hypothetical protein
MSTLKVIENFRGKVLSLTNEARVNLWDKEDKQTTAVLDVSLMTEKNLKEKDSFYMYITEDGIVIEPILFEPTNE